MQQLCAHVAVCRGWDLRPQHEDGGEGGGRHPGDHHTNRGRQRHRAEAIQILPTALGWWLPSFWKNSNFIFLHLQRRAEDPTEAVSRGWNRRPFWTSSAELYQDLSLNSLPFLFKIKTTQFLPVSIKNPLNHHENYYIQNEADWQSSFFKPTTLQLKSFGGTKADKNPRLDRGECASFPDLDYQALGIFGFSTELGTNSTPACSISSWKEDELLCIRICRTTKQLQKDRQLQHNVLPVFYLA